MNRREFLHATATTLAATTILPRAAKAASAPAISSAPTFDSATAFRPGRIVDTHVYLFRWPFGRIRHDEPAALAAKLRAHGIEEAWAGSFETLLDKDVAAVNRRLADACRGHGRLFVPFGTVNPLYPDWKDDVRRVVEEHGFRGIRVHPSYHNYDLNAPEFAALLDAAGEQKLLVQVVSWMQDERHQNPLMPVARLNVRPLVTLARSRPALRVQLVNHFRVPNAGEFIEFNASDNVFFDTSRLETIMPLQHAFAGDGLPAGQSPAAASRVAFGSYSPCFYLESNLLKLRESKLTPEQDESIRWRAARQLLPQKS